MQPATLPQSQQWNTKKRCAILSKLTMKTPEKSPSFLTFPCQWGRSGGYSCMWICFNIYPFIISFIWCTARYMMRWTHVTPNVTRSKKLCGANVLLNLRLGADFCVPENLIFPALSPSSYLHIGNSYVKKISVYFLGICINFLYKIVGMGILGTGFCFQGSH